MSDELAGLLQREHNLADLPTVVLNAPVLDAGAPSTGESGRPVPHLRELCGVGADVPILVYSGAAAEQRGLGIMIEALPRLAGVHVALVVSKSSTYVLKLTARAAELGVGDRLHLLPYVSPAQVVRYLSTADIGVIPIHHWPNHEIALITKYFEYAHARLPMVVSDVRTMADATRATGVGEVFRAEDLDDFIRAVRTVLTIPRATGPPTIATDCWRNGPGILRPSYSTRSTPGYAGIGLPTGAPERAFRTAAPDVSVIMAVYNAMPYPTTCIRSLLKQHWVLVGSRW